MENRNDHPKPAGKARTTLLTAALLLALGTAACSSNTAVQAADTDQTTGSEFVGAEQVDAVEEQVGDPAEELAFSDDTDDDEAPSDTTAPETSTPTIEAPDSSPVFGEEPGVTTVQVVNTGGETLNVRSEPRASAEVLGELAANTWNVEATGNIADVGDARWREVRLVSGETGWAHGGFLEATSPTCVDIAVTDVYESQPWDADFDADGLADVVTYIRDNSGVAVLRVEYGNGAVTAAEVANFGITPAGDIDASAVAEDIDGDGFDEIRFSTYFAAETNHEFITMDDCDFVIHEKIFFQIPFLDEGQGWACKDFGTPNAEFFDLQLAGDGSIVRAFGNTFDPADGFIGTDELTGMTSEEMAAYFDPECTTDYD